MHSCYSGGIEAREPAEGAVQGMRADREVGGLGPGCSLLPTCPVSSRNPPLMLGITVFM